MILLAEPESWKLYQRELPDGYRVMTSREAADPKNKEILTTARAFINRTVQAGAPVGHQEFKTINGEQVLFVVEPHYHAPNGKPKPWGWHHGATVFMPPVNDYWAFLYDQSPTMSFGAENILAGKDWRTRLKRFAVPGGLGLLTILNPILGGSLTVGTLAFTHFHKTAPFKGVAVSPEIHNASALPT